jgi:hypothetical protein
MHFNSADRINNRHQHYAKNLRIYCLPKAMIGMLFLHKIKCSRRLLKCDAPGLKVKQVAFHSVLKIFIFSPRMEGKKEEGGYVLATCITL